MFSKVRGGKPVSFSQAQTSEYDWLVMQMETLQKKRDFDQLKKTYEERKQTLATLDQRMNELRKSIEEAHELRFNHYMLFENRKQDLMEEVKQEVEEVPKIQAEVERLKKELVDLKERKKKLQRHLQKGLLYKDFMQRVCKLTKFKDVDKLTGYCDSLLYFRDKLFQTENQLQEHLEQQKKVLLSLKNQHNLLWLQKNNDLCQLQKVLEETRAEALSWESKWDHIQETAVKKTLELGQLKIATLSLYELIGGVIGEEGLDINDTETQLEQIKMYIMDQNDMLKQYLMSVRRQTDGN